MRKKLLTLTAFGIAFVCAAGALSTNTHFTTGATGGRWVHYQQKDATSTTDGIREYWVECGGTYQFHAPVGAQIEEATVYDTSEFAVDDPRLIKWLDDEIISYYCKETSKFNFDDAPELAGFASSDTPADAGQVTRLTFVKDDYTPAYAANCMSADKLITSNEDFSALQDKINAKSANGYYILTKDLTGTGSGNTTSGCLFTGTFDGRNHTISNPYNWGQRLFGHTDGATIKNLNFDEVSIFSTLAVTLTNTLVENVTITAADTIHELSATGFVCDIIYGSTKFRNVTVNFKQHYSKTMTPFGNYNNTNTNNVTFENVTVQALGSYNMFNHDNNGRSLKPTEINYIPTYRFFENNKHNYRIAYATGNTEAQRAANRIKTEIQNITGRTISLVAAAATNSYTASSSMILIGFNKALGDLGYPIPDAYNVNGDNTEDIGLYVVRGIGKAIFISTNHETSYIPAALDFLNAMFGYEYFGIDSSTYKVDNPKKIDLVPLSIVNTPACLYRKLDAYDSPTLTGFDGTELGYNDGFGDYGRFVLAPAVPADQRTEIDVNATGGQGSLDVFSQSQYFHTSTFIVYPQTYFSSHRAWFAEGEDTVVKKSTIGGTKTFTIKEYFGFKANYNISGNWLTGYKQEGETTYTCNAPIYSQLCYTAHGDATEFDALVQLVTDKAIELFASNTNRIGNILLFGTGDNHNCCKCDACDAATEQYGSSVGAVVNFANEVSRRVNARIGETGKENVYISIFGYIEYKQPPVKNGTATITADPGVRIMVAPIESDFTKPITDTVNATAYNNLKDWAKVGGLFLWVYHTNFHNYLYPYNSYESSALNIPVYHDLGVEMIFHQGKNGIYYERTAFYALKLYVNGKIMIKPTLSYDNVVDTFFNNYYGGQGPKMRQMFNEVVTRLEYISSNDSFQDALYDKNQGSIYQSIDNKAFWDLDQLLSWYNICKQAYEAESDSVAKRHILVESIFPKFAICSLFTASDLPNINDYRLEFLADCETFGIERLNEPNTKTVSAYRSSWGL